MIKISNRLETVAGMVSENVRLCDVGTDHGYVPIYLLQKEQIASAIAMDVNEGPLLRARAHIRDWNLEAYIQTRLSDGLHAVKAGEVDSIVIAGMGGGLMIRILTEGRKVVESASELILQPQSDIELVRGFVEEIGYGIDKQEMVKEDGKFYMAFRCRKGMAQVSIEEQKVKERLTEEGMTEADWQLMCHRYGKHLLLQGHPVLLEYLEREKKLLEQIEASLVGQPVNERIDSRKQEVAEKGRILSYARICMRRR